MQPIQNTSIESPEYRDLPISQLVESPTNPRKRYQQASLEELAQSFRSRGVLEPLLVRPVEPERFEIVAGSRRYRAARIAELQTVPARVREMTDAEALEVHVSKIFRGKIFIRSKRRKDFGRCFACLINNTQSRVLGNVLEKAPRISPAD